MMICATCGLIQVHFFLDFWTESIKYINIQLFIKKIVVQNTVQNTVQKFKK